MRHIVNVGDEIEVYGNVFILMEMTQKTNTPPKLVFKHPTELLLQGRRLSDSEANQFPMLLPMKHR